MSADLRSCRSAGCYRGGYRSGPVTAGCRIWVDGQETCEVTCFHYCGRPNLHFVIRRGDPWIKLWED